MERIALIRSASSNVPKSSYNVQEIGLAKELAKKGMYVDVFLISDTGRTYYEKCGIDDRVTVYRLKGIKIPGQQGIYRELTTILNKNKYDLIQALDDSQITTVFVSKYCKKNKIKFVLWQGMYENYPEKFKRIIQYVYDATLLKILRRNTKYTISKTTSAQNYLVSKKFPRGIVIPVGLEISNFNENNKINYREKLGIMPNRKILLYVGKVEERRKPIFCIDVYNKVKEKFPDCCLVYVGKGPMLNQTKEYAKQKNSKDIFFIDKIPQSELSGLYQESDIFLLPTRYEIFGMVLMEAMYFGTPVITYKAAGPIDVISDDIDGFTMNNFDSEIWSQKIVEAFEKRDLKEMGKRGKDKILDEYLWTHIASKYFDEYKRIVEEK